MKFKLNNKEIELTEEEVQEIVKQNSKPKGVEIKRWDNGEVIFASTKQTMKEAVEEAVNEGVSLSYANLFDTNLPNTNLSRVNLHNADLRNADLYNAHLQNANLYNAKLYHADLHNANFYGKGGTQKLTKEQVPDFLKALGFIIE